MTRPKRLLIFRLATAGLLAGLSVTLSAHPTLAAGVSGDFKVIQSLGNEQHERNVDEAAVAAQEKAIQRLNQLLKKYRGTGQEPVLLAKLADFQQQNAAILFRLSHGKSSTNLTRYRQGMKEAINTFSQLIARYPSYEDIFRAYYGRGKGYEEVGEQTLATKDYLHLVQHFPDTEEAAPAFMALAEFAIQANEHAKAIGYLVEVEKRQDSPHYPFALYKLAWSHYNLKNITTALNYAERQISFYNSRLPKKTDKSNDSDGAISSDYALRDNTLMDVAVFYFEGYEQKVAQFSLDNALAYFKSVEDGHSLGRMYARFAKLLRSHGHDTDLITWKDQVLAGYSDRPETLDVVILATEYQLNKRRYPQLVESVGDITKLYQRHKGYEGFARAQALILESAETLQTAMLKNKTADDVKTYSPTLASLYEAFVKIVDESDPRIPRVHFNLAETLFAIKDYEGATNHYRWVVEHVKPRDLKANLALTKNKKPAAADANVSEGDLLDASLRAISSRYEVLRQKSLIPQDLRSRSLAKNSTDSLDPQLAQWIEWIDDHTKKSDRDVSQFAFEAARALYAKNHIQDSVDRLMKFVKKYPKSDLTPGAASLILDTHIASEDWVRTHELATDFMKTFNTGEFFGKLALIASDAFYKRVEVSHRRQDYKTTLSLADEFVKLYPNSRKVADAMSMAGGAALATSDKKRAAGYFSRLIDTAKVNFKDVGSQNLGAALLARGQLAEDRYRFAAAAADYRAFLALPPGSFKVEGSKADDLRRKTLILSWLSADPAELKQSLNSPVVCNATTSTECDHLRILDILADPEKARDPKMTEEAFELSRRNESDKQARTLWAVVALEGSRNLAFRDRHVALRNIAAGWNDLEPLARYTVLPYLTVSIPKAFEMNRIGMKDVAPLRADERYITRRVEVIHELENTATQVMKLPWARIRAETINEVAASYLDFARGIVDLKPPKGLNDAEVAAYQETMRRITMPFDEKGQEMRAKAFEIASKYAIEEESFKRISEPFFAENPSQAKKLKPATQVDAPATLGLETLSALDPAGDWSSYGKANAKVPDAEDPASLVKFYWAQALRTHQWQQIAFFMQEANEKVLVSAGVLSAVKAVSLASAGARGEGLGELEESSKDLPKTRLAATSILMHHYLRSCSKEKTLSYYKDLQSELASRNETGNAEQRKLESAAKTYVPN